MLKRLHINKTIPNNVSKALDVYEHPTMNHNNSLGGVTATYYNVNNKSTFGIGSKQIREIIGSESPLRFNKIKSYKIIMNGSVGATEEESEEQGLSYNTDMTCYTYPDGATPLENDFIIFDHMPNSLYKVNKVQRSSILNKPYWSIDISVHGTNNGTLFEDLETQVTDNFTFMSDTMVGKEIRMIRDSNLDIIDSIQEAMELLINDFKDVFVDPVYKYIRSLDDEGNETILPDIIQFINDHRLLDYDNHIFIATMDVPISLGFKSSYTRGILNKLVTGTTIKDADYEYAKINYTDDNLKFYRTVRNAKNITVLSRDKRLIAMTNKYFTTEKITIDKLPEDISIDKDPSDIINMVHDDYPESDLNSLVKTIYILYVLKYMKNNLLTDNNNYNNYNKVIGG